MNYLVVAVPNDPELAGWIGKKGSVNGITFYNRRVEDNVLTVLTPTNLEEKFYALGEILTIANAIVISTKNVDANFGEAVIAAALMKRRVLLTDENDVSGMIGKIGLDYEIVDRNSLLDKLSGIALQQSPAGTLRVEIDKVFPVKGVGTVLLGVVRSGEVRVHDKLYLGSGRELQVRSIQVQDEDREHATAGARVGLAVKGIEERDLEKGEVLAPQQIKMRGEFGASVTMSPMQKELSEEAQYTLVSGFADVPCKISKDGNRYMIKLGKAMQVEKGQQFIVLREKSPRILCAGAVLE